MITRALIVAFILLGIPVGLAFVPPFLHAAKLHSYHHGGSTKKVNPLYSSTPPSLQQQQQDKQDDEHAKAVALLLEKQERGIDINGMVNTGESLQRLEKYEPHLTHFPAAIVTVGLLILSTLATVDSSIQRGWTTLEIASRLPVDNWNSYSAVLEASPLRTKAITSATVYAIGDCISQVSTGSDVSTLDRGRSE